MMNQISHVIFLGLSIVSSSLLLAQERGPIQFGSSKGIVHDISFLNNGTALAVAEKNTISIYNVENQELIRTLNSEDQETIMAVDVSPDNSLLVAGNKNGVISLWDIESEQLINSLHYHEGIITDVIFSRDQQFIISSSTDNLVIVYDLVNDQIKHKFEKHQDDVLTVAASSDSSTIASAGADKMIYLWDVSTGQELGAIETASWIRSISFNHRGTELVYCGDDSKAYRVDLRKSKLVVGQDYKYGKDWLLSSNYFHDNRTFVVAGMDGSLTIKYDFGKYKYKCGYPITQAIFNQMR